MAEREAKEMGERLARALLPVLLHRVRNSTQLLSGIRSLLEIAPTDVPESCAEDLAEASREAFENGWMLGVLASALGAEVFGARERRDGLEPLLRWLREALLREQRVLQWSDDEVPDPCAGGGRAGSTAWCASFASLVYESCAASSGTSRLGFSRASITLDRVDETAARRAFEAGLLPSTGAKLAFDGGGWRLDVPAGTLEFRA